MKSVGTTQKKIQCMSTIRIIDNIMQTEYTPLSLEDTADQTSVRSHMSSVSPTVRHSTPSSGETDSVSSLDISTFGTNEFASAIDNTLGVDGLSLSICNTFGVSDVVSSADNSFSVDCLSSSMPVFISPFDNTFCAHNLSESLRNISSVYHPSSPAECTRTLDIHGDTSSANTDIALESDLRSRSEVELVVKTSKESKEPVDSSPPRCPYGIEHPPAPGKTTTRIRIRRHNTHRIGRRLRSKLWKQIKQAGNPDRKQWRDRHTFTAEYVHSLQSSIPQL